MSLLDNLRKALATKEPSFSVTRSQNWDDFTYLTKQTNYFEQYFGWAYRASLINAQSVASYPIRFYEGKRDDYHEVFADDGNQLATDLEFFNPFMHLYEARLLKELHLSLTGTAFWAIFNSDVKGHRFEFYVLDPTRVRVSTNGRGLPDHYIYTDASGSDHRIELEDIIVFKQPNPQNWLTGYSVLQASRLPHNTWELAEKFNMNVFGNMSRPEGIITLEDASADEVKAFEKKFKAKYGKVRNAGKMAFMNRAVSFLKLTENQRDLQYVEGIREMRDEILSFHGVPKPLVGLTDSTFTNSSEAQKVYQRYTLKPKLISESEVVNSQIIPKYYLGVEKYKRIFSLPENPVENDKKEMAEVSEKLYSGEIITLNEAREMNGYEALGDEGEIFKKRNVIQLTPPVGEEEKPEEEKPEEEPEEEPKKEVSYLETKLKFAKSPYSQKLVAESLATIRERSKDELKEVFAEKFEEREARFADLSRTFLKDQGKRIIEGLGLPKKSITINYSIDWAKEEALTVETYRDIFEEVMIYAWRDASSLTGLSTEIGLEAEKLINDRLLKFAQEINKTTRKKVTDLIMRAVEEGWTETQLAEQLEAKFEHWANAGENAQSRAELFARTEVGTIMSDAMMSNYRSSGVVPRKAWLSSRDKFVREWHREENILPSIEIGIDEPFVVEGELLDAPRMGWNGYSVSGKNAIGCRCVALPIVNM